MAAPAAAQAPAQLPVQGYLTDAQGEPIGDPVEVTFTLYDADGEVLHREMQSIQLHGGLFSALLGAGDEPLSLSGYIIFRM